MPESSILSAQAHAFVPRQVQHNGRGRGRGRAPPPRRRRPSRSSNIKLDERILADIEHGRYECAICTESVTRKSKIWSCHTCWAIFHQSCTRSWAKSIMKEQGVRPDGTMSSKWRCPGCNTAREEPPEDYTCWCGKEQNPRPLAGSAPHSCSQSCGKRPSNSPRCPHPCVLECHPGPCPPCKHLGPAISCHCGRKKKQEPCQETDYETGWSCAEVCGKIQDCVQHPCPRECHTGPCGPCIAAVPSICWCGHLEKSIPCSQTNVTIQCQSTEAGKGNVRSWNGSFSCTQQCPRFFECGKHRCGLPCHPHPITARHCPVSPSSITHCPCGKTPLSTILDRPRIACDEPIPHCDKQCGKVLRCGHTCQKTCHGGACGVCFEMIEINCQCGRTTSRSMCHQGTIEPPQCPRVCRAPLSCGRHTCRERCCPGEHRPKPMGRAKQRHPRMEFESEHICTKVCGRPLKCGNHTCPQLCHTGPCESCREAIFDEITCACTRTVLYPPQPCGTRAPQCRYDCTRSKSCGHPQIPHPCHEDDVPCAKCPFLTTKPCMCGRQTLKNQPCWSTRPNCGQRCDRALSCNLHACRKTCHPDGECEDDEGPCQQVCGQSKSCTHPCLERCHGDSSCPEIAACTAKIIVACACLRQRKEMKCGSTQDSDGNRAKELQCDDECARLIRNKQLAAALDIDENHMDDHIPYSKETMTLSNELGREWAQEQEILLRTFAADKTERRLRFRPMAGPQRQFLHVLSTDFGFETESLDPEPHRHVLVLKTVKFVSAPIKTLAQCLKVQQRAAKALSRPPSPKHRKEGLPFNALRLVTPRFGITEGEIKAELYPDLDIPCEVQFLLSEDVVLVPKLTESTESQRETLLSGIRPAVAKATAANQTAARLELCRVDHALNIVRYEEDPAAALNGGADGWSRVVANAAKRTHAPIKPALGGTSTFAVLGGKKVTPLNNGTSATPSSWDDRLLPAAGLLSNKERKRLALRQREDEARKSASAKSQEQELLAKEPIMEDWEEWTDMEKKDNSVEQVAG